MKIKKIMLIIITILCLAGCVNIKNLSYDEILNTLSNKPKNANTFKKGYQYYVPDGLSLNDSGTNYAVLSSSDITYYLYVDMVSYINKNPKEYEIDNTLEYSKRINYDNKTGFVEIKLVENNKYLIEIMYNYAKIELMVEESLINKALINSISILNSIEYNDTIIENIINSDKLNYTEENYELFDEEKNNSNILNYIEEDEEKVEQEEIKDTDFIN